MAGTSVPKFHAHRKVFVLAFAVLLIAWLSINSSARNASGPIYQASRIHPFGDAATHLPGAATFTASIDGAVVTLHAASLDPNALYTVWEVV